MFDVREICRAQRTIVVGQSIIAEIVKHKLLRRLKDGQYFFAAFVTNSQNLQACCWEASCAHVMCISVDFKMRMVGHDSVPVIAVENVAMCLEAYSSGNLRGPVYVKFPISLRFM